MLVFNICLTLMSFIIVLKVVILELESKFMSYIFFALSLSIILLTFILMFSTKPETFPFPIVLLIISPWFISSCIETILFLSKLNIIYINRVLMESLIYVWAVFLLPSLISYIIFLVSLPYIH